MNRLIAIALLALPFAAGQEVTPMVTSVSDVRKLVPVKHVQTSDPQVESLMHTLGVKAAGPIAGYIVLNGPKDAVAAAEEVLQKMDVQKPAPDIEITGWLIVAVHNETGLQPLPPSLQPVANQLNKAFGYSNLKLLTSFIVRAHPGTSGRTTGEISGQFPGDKSGNLTYEFNFRRLEVDAPAVRIRDMNLRLVPGSVVRAVTISNDVDLVEGQKVVIGKTSVLLGEEMPLMLVLSARTAE